VGTTPNDGLCPYTPQNAAGTRTEPPMSVPISKLVIPHATAAAAPPDEPPGTQVRSHGLLVVPNISLNVWEVARPQRHVGLANHDRAGVLDRRHDLRVILRHVVQQRLGTARRTDALGRDRVLHGDRNAVQSSPRLASSRRLVRSLRPLPGRISHHRAHCVDLRVEPFDAGQFGVQQFHAAELSPMNRRGLLRRRPQCRVARSHRRSVAIRVLANVGV